MAVLKVRLEDRARPGYSREQGHLRGEVLSIHPDDKAPVARRSRSSFAWIRVDLTKAEQAALLEPDYGDGPVPVDPGDDPMFCMPAPLRPRKILLDPDKLRVALAEKDRAAHDKAWTYGVDQGDVLAVEMAAVDASKTATTSVLAARSR